MTKARGKKIGFALGAVGMIILCYLLSLAVAGPVRIGSRTYNLSRFAWACMFAGLSWFVLIQVRMWWTEFLKWRKTVGDFHAYIDEPIRQILIAHGASQEQLSRYDRAMQDFLVAVYKNPKALRAFGDVAAQVCSMLGSPWLSWRVQNFKKEEEDEKA